MPLVLVIDDDAPLRRMVRRILTEASHEVAEAEDGEAGLALLRKEQPALVLTDLVMPKKEGIETIREIRRTSPETRVIAMSGSDFGPSATLYLHAAEKLGADAVLAKPFRADELLQTIARVLTNARGH
jgi:two-component system, chemotaxis family, chemotaxis protein CheY